ncbi:MAG: TonB-dependent receptor plug domain-containing protein, partial [Propionivibrio sp.]
MKTLRRTLAVAIVASAATLSAPVAAAEGADFTDLDLEALMATTVSSASKFVQSEREAPSAVEVITREDIRRHAWRTLNEALVSLTGVYSVTDRAYDRLGARGFLIPGDYNTRFLLLIDGQRVDDNTYGQATFGHEFPLDLALVERIEYVPGPGSSIYGSNALFGVINVITRRAAQMPPAQLAVRLTDDGWREGRVTLAHTLDSGASLLLSATEASRPGSDQTY